MNKNNSMYMRKIFKRVVVLYGVSRTANRCTKHHVLKRIMEGQFIFLFTWILHIAEACDYSFTFPTLNSSVYTVQENEYISLPFNLTSACGVPPDTKITVGKQPGEFLAIICMIRYVNGSCFSGNKTCRCLSHRGEYELKTNITKSDSTTWVWKWNHKLETTVVFNVTGVAADVNSTTQQRPDDSEAAANSSGPHLGKSDGGLLDNIAAAGVGALVMASVGVTVIVVCKRCKGEEGCKMGRCKERSAWRHYSYRTTAGAVPEPTDRDYSDVVDTIENPAVDESGAVVVKDDADEDFTSRVTLVNQQNQPADSLTQHATASMDVPALSFVPEHLARHYSDVVDTIENPTVDESGVAQAVVVVVNDDDDGDFTSRVTLVNEQNQPAGSLSQHAAPPMDLPALFGADTGGPRDYVSVSKIRDAKRRAMDETQC